MKISTEYWAKPIPDRNYDWSAIDSDTYDGAPDSSNRSHIGWGPTERLAIEDLHDRLHDEIVGDEKLEDHEVKRFIAELDAQFAPYLAEAK